MTTFYASYPPSISGAGVPTYSTFSAFPSASSAGNGALAIALDTDTLYISNGTAWEVIGGPGVALSIGTFDSEGTPSANGLTISSNALIAQSASATVPGMINISTQTLAGIKTFNSPPNFSSLTASLPLQLDSSNNVTAAAINLNSAEITGTLQTTHGGTGVTSLGNLTEATSAVLTITGGTGAVIDNTTIQVKQAGTSQNGYLSSTDWNTFNNKQGSGSYITALTGDVTASGPGSATATLAATTNATLATLSGLTTASSLATVGTITSGTWNATTLGVTHGGTGVISVTTTPTATSFAGWDASSQLSMAKAIVGLGDGTGSVTGGGVRGPAASGSNITGANTTFDASNGTGTGGSGLLIFRTAPAGSTGSSTNTLQTNLQISATGQVSVGPAVATQASFSGNALRGVSNGASISTGMIGELISASSSSTTNFPSTGTWGGAVSLALTAGLWSISAMGYFQAAGATVIYVQMCISTDSGNDTTGSTLGTNITSKNGPTATYDQTDCIPPYTINISSSTTYYLKFRANYSVATPNYAYQVQAVRIG